MVREKILDQTRAGIIGGETAARHRCRMAARVFLRRRFDALRTIIFPLGPNSVSVTDSYPTTVTRPIDIEALEERALNLMANGI